MKKFLIAEVKKVGREYVTVFKAYRRDIKDFDATSYKDFGVLQFDTEAEAREKIDKETQVVVLEDM